MGSYSYLQSTGAIIPDTSDLLTEVQNEFKAAFGSDLVVTPDTPQGVLIASETIARDAVVRNNAALANQINPNLASGLFLDAICALTGMQRLAATRSTVTATCTGVSGTIIPAGSIARTAAGDQFETTGDVVISGGSATATFQSVEYGPVAAPAGELTQIVSGILGWETVNNTSSATLGSEEQSDESLRVARRNALALQGISMAAAITSALYNVEGVKSLQFRENVAATSQVIDGITMAAHSVFACVDGGTDADVGAALLNNKTAGAGWNGSTVVNVEEPYSGQTYVVSFDRPLEVQVYIRATVKMTTSITDPASTVKNAIMSYVSGELTDEAGFAVGRPVSPFELSGAVNRLSPTIYVKNLEVSDDAGVTWSNSEIAIALNEVARTDPSQITVVLA